MKSHNRLIAPPKEHGTTQSFDGVQIYWERHGPHPLESKFPPSLFCYGLVCSFNQWRHQIERYASDRAVILFDYRGHHKSQSPEAVSGFNMSACAKDGVAALKAAGVQQPADVWGHSMGCSVAIELAASHPELVRSLILCCGSLKNPFENMFGGKWLDVLVRPILDYLPQKPELFYTSWELIQKRPELTEFVAKIAGFNMSSTAKPEDVHMYTKAVSSVEPRVFFSLLRELMKANTLGLARRIKTPAAVIAGARDLVTPPLNQKHMADSLSESKYIEIPAGSHNVQIDFGEYVCMKVEEFWRERGL